MKLTLKALILLLIGLATWVSVLQGEESAGDPVSPNRVFVVPIKGQISQPQLFILRRALKMAIEEDVGTVIVELDTPGGALSTTLAMMEALERFRGRTIAFVNDEAISAGAFIATATGLIYMTERGIIGSAEVVMGTGEDVPGAMKRKINSYMQARVRVLSEEYRYRGDVVRAMSDPDFTLEIDGVVIKEAGTLLTLTGTEAIRPFGDPPQNLLAEGLYADVESLLDDLIGAGEYEIVEFELTWSEELAKYLTRIAPGLLGLGLLLLFIEFKTPGFGVFGLAGIALLLTVFAANYVAGLAGYEEVIVFFLGVALIFLEILVFPGVIFLAGIGLLMVLGSLIWAMTDFWPEGSDFTFTADMLVVPMLNTFVGFGLGIAGLILSARFLPRGWLWGRLMLTEVIGRTESGIPVGREAGIQPDADPKAAGARAGLPAVGAEGITVTDLYPSGEVEIDGRRFQARAVLRQIERGTDVVVVDHRDFALVVRERE